jgi:hypothetical protein
MCWSNMLVKPNFVISKGVVQKAQLFWNINLKNFQKLEGRMQKTYMFIVDDHYIQEKVL